MFLPLIRISTLCKHFDFKLEVKPEAIRERFEFTMYPENLKVTFVPVVID